MYLILGYTCILLQENLKVLFMQSDGGLTLMNSFNGSKAILSGPAGGVVSPSNRFCCTHR